MRPSQMSAGHYINHQWVSSDGDLFTSINPIDNTVVWQGRMATENEVVAACHAAHEALASWASLSFNHRKKHIEDFSKHVDAKRQELAQLIAIETGKPLWEAMTEAASVIGKAALSIQAYQERTAPQQTSHIDVINALRFKPHGVVAVLGPFNFPAHLSNGHIIPALLAGNTIVYKPSELTPAVAEFIVQCWHDSGLPAGVINCIQGDAQTAKYLLEQDIQGVYFTGSYHTGVSINKQLSHRPDVILALEMGGNNPLVIDKLKDLDAAVYNALLSTFITAGQRCTCARRMMIPDTNEGDQFLSLFLKAATSLKVGSFANQPQPFMGPVISHKHALSHLDAQEKLLQMGGVSLLSMRLLAENTGLLSPGVMDMSAVKNAPDEEIFAPFVQIYRSHDFEHALKLANQTRYGLSAGLFSDNPNHYQQFYQTIRAGLINWNRPTTGADSSLPFGGVGRSGNNRPSAYFAADYCAYPIASVEQTTLSVPQTMLPGIVL